MAAFAGFYTLLGIALIVFALIPKSPLRKWIKGRARPGVAGSALLGAWLAGFLLLVIFVPATPVPKTTAADTAATQTTAPTTTAKTEEQAAATTAQHPAGAPQDVPADAQKATVARIVDGDTLELSAVAAGAVLGSTQQVDVRLLEIDTPETKDPNEPVQCYGAEASSKLEELAPPGSTVWVQRDEELRDRYGRYLLYLWNADGVFVNLTLVEGGYAKAALYVPNDKHWETISAANYDSRAADEGLWGACAYFGQPEDTPEPSSAPQDEDTYVPAPDPNVDVDKPRSGGKPGCNPLTARDGDGDGIVCET